MQTGVERTRGRRDQALRALEQRAHDPEHRDEQEESAVDDPERKVTAPPEDPAELELEGSIKNGPDGPRRRRAE